MKDFWRKLRFADKLQLVGLVLTIGSLLGVWYQLRLNNATNKVSIRGQLYEREAGMASEEAADDTPTLNSIWALVPTQVTGQQYATTLLKLVTDDPAVINAKNVGELYHSLFDAAVFADDARCKATHNLRRLFLYTQTTFYHVHMALDYREDKILSKQEFSTWKGLIRETHSHPMLLAVIWQGHQNRYFTQKFARFLQAELCSDTVPSDVTDAEEFKRGRDFIRYFYPEMTKEDWPNGLPDY